MLMVKQTAGHEWEIGFGVADTGCSFAREEDEAEEGEEGARWWCGKERMGGISDRTGGARKWEHGVRLQCVRKAWIGCFGDRWYFLCIRRLMVAIISESIRGKKQE